MLANIPTNNTTNPNVTPNKTNVSNVGKGNAKPTQPAVTKTVTTNALTPTGYILVKPSNATHIATPTPQGNAVKATTLILQLLPLTNNAGLTPQTMQQVQQLLLHAGYLLQQTTNPAVNKQRIVPTYVGANNVKTNP